MVNLKDKNQVLLIGIVIGVLAGGICGWVFGEAMVSWKWVGVLFLNALKMIIIPLVIFSMITGMTSLGTGKKLGRLGVRTMIYYITTTAFAVMIGIFLVNLIQPGKGLNYVVEKTSETSAQKIQKTVEEIEKDAIKSTELDLMRKTAKPKELTGKVKETVEIRKEQNFADVLIEVFTGMISPNLFKSMVDTKILPLIFFSLLLGAVLMSMGDRAQLAIDFFRIMNEAVIKMVDLILWFSPLGMFALIASRLGAAGGGEAFTTELIKVGEYSLTVLLGLFLHGMIILPLLLLLLGRVNPIQYAKNMFTALTTAFATASSSATLPVTLECVEEKNKVPNEAAGFVLPLGATVNMDGTALYEAVAAIFIAQAYNIDLSIGQQVIIFLTSNLAAIGAAGIPQAGLVTMVLVLQSVGLPVEGIGAILAIDWFLDRFRTTVNVWGDAVGAAVIAKTSL
ncbi:MAG: dicarboxylate/amino acid:cation symporter [Candidatus Hydrogenedentota bacterium]|nr:MAG: dicarboxylate/amino acid:cation symporter [Candidatus Hydrogenedentota bacterium]